MILQTLAVAIGGSIGAIGRYFISKRCNGVVPWGTFAVNILGSYLLGWYVSDGSERILESFYATGFLGAFTTFSTLQFEAVTIYRRDKKKVVLYLILSYTLGLVAAWTGFMIGKI